MSERVLRFGPGREEFGVVYVQEEIVQIGLGWKSNIGDRSEGSVIQLSRKGPCYYIYNGIHRARDTIG